MSLAHRTPHTAHRTPHTAHRTPHTAHRTPHTAHRTPHTAHRTLILLYIITLNFILTPCEVSAETIRNILTPKYMSAQAVSGMFLKDFDEQDPSEWAVTVRSKLYMAARYQKPIWGDALSSPVRYTTNYNAAQNTGLGPLNATWQRGPIGGSLAQSTVQLNGYSGEALAKPSV